MNASQANASKTSGKTSGAPVPRRRYVRFAARIALAGAGALALAGCAHHGVSLPFHHHHNHRPTTELPASNITTIGVNAYLWRASLDTLSFMPLLQTDSQGGVIVTDWYTNPNNPGDRMKLTVTILDRDLRADALRIAASRQVLSGGQWVEAPVQAATVQKLEDVILTKARDIRRDAIAH